MAPCPGSSALRRCSRSPALLAPSRGRPCARPVPARPAEPRDARARVALRSGRGPRAAPGGRMGGSPSSRRVAQAAPRPARAGDANGGVPRRPCRDRGGAAVRDRALRHDAVLDPHGPAPPPDARGRRRCWRCPRRSPSCCAPPHPRGGDGSLACSTPDRSRPWAIRSWRGSRSRSSCGPATSRHCSTSRSRTRWSTRPSTSRSWRRACCSGGRSWARTRLGDGSATRCGPCTCCSRCPRARSSGC